ncbi:MAG: fibronectin type III domain-containing protein [Prevotella sp.]|nr:fibronectin type III domain-containing protein [Prevotella sp.]
MKKHRLLFLWLSLLLCAVGARADEVQIGSGDTNNQYLPGYNYYNYSYTQQIYTADEIGASGAITSIAFKNTGAQKTRNYSIYMAHTDLDAFADDNSWVPLSASDLVFAGELTFTVGEWTTIELDTPFEYNGKSNLLVAVADNTGSYSSSPHMACLVFSAGNQAIRTYRDASAYDITNPGVAGTLLTVKNQIILNIGDAPTCPKPKNLAVNYEGGATAEVTWTTEASSSNLSVNGTVINDVTSPYTLEDLELATAYEVKVQSACGGSDVSDWTSAVSFVTDICMPEDQCLITLKLTDSYGDGWNGNAIEVVDAETGKVLGTFANTSDAGAGEAQSYTLSVCNGRAINFQWVKGSYPGEASWVIYDVNEEEITSGEGTSSMATGDVIATYTVDCTQATCLTPKDLKADEVTAYSATLSWTPGTEDQSAWEIVYSTEEDFDPDTDTPMAADSNPFELTGLQPETTYYAYVRAACSSDDHSKWSNKVSFTTIEACVTPTNVTASDITANSATISWEGNADNYEIRYTTDSGKWLQYDDDTYSTSIGNSSSMTWTWGVMYPGSMVTIDKLSKIAIYENSYNTEPITVNIYSGGDDAPGTLLYTEEVTPVGNGMHVVTLDETVSVTTGENLWITLTETGTWVLNACASTEPNSDWVLNGTSWGHLSELASSLAGNGWMIRGYLGEPLDPETAEWTTGSCTENTYPLDGLDPETDYLFQVRAKCDEESYSRWAETNFTTEAADATPEIEITEVTATTATVDWTDKGTDPTSWDLKYRLAGESFERGVLPNGWTTIDADGDGNNWYVTSVGSRTGNYCITSASYANSTALTPDNWLISPEVTLGGYMTFFAAGQDPSYAAEHFAVYLSQDGNDDPSKFTQIYPNTGELEATGEYLVHYVNLNKYKGTGYLAIRHFNVTDMFRLNIDDIKIIAPGQSTDWVEMNGLTSHPVTIEGLDPETNYEVQVCTHFASGDVSDWASTNFTTAPLSITLLDEDAGSNKGVINSYNGLTTDVVISGRNFLKNGNWNTLCLPFNVDDIEASPLAGATIKELTAARIEGTMLYLTYTDVTSIEADKSYIIKWDSGENGDMTFEGVTLNISDGPAYYGYYLSQIGTDIYSYYTYTQIYLPANECYLYLGGDNKMYYPDSDGININAFRTFIEIPEDAGVNNTMFEIDGTATSIEEVNGLEIVSNKWFTIDGRQLPKQPTQKGIYINNGRKVVVK